MPANKYMWVYIGMQSRGVLTILGVSHGKLCPSWGEGTGFLPGSVLSLGGLFIQQTCG